MGTDLLHRGVGFGEVFTTGAFSLEKIGHGVKPHAVHSKVQPEVQRLDHLLQNLGVLVIEVGLVREETVPVIRLSDVVPGPIGTFDVFEDDAGVLVFLRSVAPDVEFPPTAAGLGPPRALKPGVLIGGMVTSSAQCKELVQLG